MIKCEDGDDDGGADAWTLIAINEGVNEGRTSTNRYSFRDQNLSLVQRLQLYELCVTSLQG